MNTNNQVDQLTVDQANTTLAIASTKQQRIDAYKALSQASMREIERLEGNDTTDGYRLITRLIEARNTLTMAAQYIEYSGYGQPGRAAINELDQAMVHITIAIEAL